MNDLTTEQIDAIRKRGGFADYDAGLLNDFGGGNVEWWLDYLRAEIGRANDFWRTQADAALTAANERAERAEEELSIWKSVFPDIAPQNVLPDRSLLEAENAGLSARVERLEADNIRLISQLVSANIVIIAAENEHRANHNKA